MAYEQQKRTEEHFFYTKEVEEGQYRDRSRVSVRKGRIAGTLAAGITTLSMMMCGWTTVPAGNVGVRNMMGNVRAEEFSPGFTLKNPLESVVDMSTRTREIKEAMQVPTSEGLIAGLEVSVLYRLDGTKAEDVYKKLGGDKAYEENFVAPTIRSTGRDVVANYKAEDLYSGKREEIAQRMAKQLETEMGKRHLVLEKVLIRDLKLPDTLTKAIVDKMSMEQEALKMDYTLQKQAKESERLRVEARGIADSQKIIAQSLTPEYLQWKYVETLQSTVNSPNNTTVILPFDTKLTPMLPVGTHK
ncbi:TPA: prohibitin family protein [Candidatus Woesearchaeota archaeon]|nr:prohibitin family protein [Candidatus Woesearchaeota archaeon]